MAVCNPEVPSFHVSREVAHLDEISVHGDAAAHHVVRDVREVMGRREFVPRALESVPARHDLSQALGPSADRHREVARPVGHQAKVTNEGGHSWLTEADVRYDRPGFAGTRLQLDGGAQEVPSRHTRDERAVEVIARIKEVRSLRVERHRGAVHARGPRGRRTKRLRGLWSVGQERLERVHGQTQVGIDQLAALVGVREIAHRQVDGRIQPVWEDAPKPVPHLDNASRRPVIGEQGSSNEAKTFTARPAVPEREAGRLVVLFEDG